MSSKYSKKRKQEDDDTTEGSRRRHDSSRSPSPSKSKRSAKHREPEDDGEPAESMSIEETNKLRASLGLAPLEANESKVRDADDGTDEKIYNEDGFEFRHKKADNWADKKKEKEMKEKLETSKTKREVYSKVLKAKKLADSDDEDSAADFVEKMRRKDDEAKKAAERAAAFDQLDEELGVSAIVDKARKPKRPKGPKGPSDTAGMVIGHGREAFVDGDQILVLEDKGVLDDGDEVLVNPNFLDDERHKRNVELRKRKDTRRNFDEDVDEFGNVKNFGVLAKYDETLEGEERKQFRLDEHGGVDLEEEKREMEAFRRMKMAGKRLESLVTKKNAAADFYTQDEFIQFRKVKKGKKEKNIRKRKVLKASDLVPIEKAGEGSSRDFGRRRRDSGDAEEDINDRKERKDQKEEDGEIMEKEEDGKWKKAMPGNGVDLERLQKLRALTKKTSDDEDSDDDMFGGGVDLTGVVIDDNAEEELHSMLAKTRKVKEIEGKPIDEDVGKRVQEMLSTHGVKMEFDDEQDVKPAHKDGSLFIDSTTEYCRHVGEITTLGLGGNRAVDVSEVQKVVKQEEDVEEGEGFEKWKRAKVDKELKEKERKRKQDKGGWLAAGKPAPGNSRMDSDDEEALEEAKKKKWSDEEEEEESDEGDYTPALGKEVDVSKGVGQMLKLAGQKGYLTNPNAKSVNGPSLDHLKNKATTRVDASRFDPDDRNAKKADRLNSQNRGPVMPFAEKVDYKPEVNISYVDKKGREMDAKDAYRELSYKFHGRNPGKKQLEKRANRKDKEERMLKTNSYDTPLGTLSKQLKKQKQLSTPYLVLSGSNDHSSLKKE